MKKSCLLALVLLIIAISVNTSRADQWAITYGENDEDRTYSIQETTDYKYIVAGYTNSFGAGDSDSWVMKLDSDGTIIWEKYYGGSDTDWARAIKETSDGKYIVAGYTESFGADESDAWVLKLNIDGGVNWENRYGGCDGDRATTIQETSDEGYIVAGHTNSFGASGSDVWVMKLDSDGTIPWQNRYEGTDDDRASCIQQTDADGYIVAGETWTSVSGMTNDSDILVLKLTSTGTISWQKTYGDTENDSASCIQQTSDGGYILAGDSRSFSGISSIWVLKLESDGDITWQKTYGGVLPWSYASSIQETSDGKYIVAGYTYSFGAGFYDSWVLKLDGEGEHAGDILWQKTYGGSYFDLTFSIQQTTDAGYIMAGYTNSFGAGGYDAWVLKVDSSGNIPDCSIIGISEAIASDTEISAEESYLTVESTTATPIPTTASTGDTSAETKTICPGEDSDGDGVLDDDDNCPNTPNPGQEDTRPPGGNNCGDACECEGNFDGDSDVDGDDVTTFVIDIGRNMWNNPCTNEDPCNGDFDCDGDVDGDDVTTIVIDIGRNIWNNPCPPCSGYICEY